jgi:hypothetical protein
MKGGVLQMLDYVFSGLYAAGFLFLLVLELIGVHSKRPGDTITENWRFLDSHLHGPLQWGWRVMTAGTLVWILLHFGGAWH